MKPWKITNISNAPVKIVIAKSPGVTIARKIESNQFLICLPKQTPVIDAQLRRKFISIEKDFDNEAYGFEIGVVYDQSTLEAKKLEIAEANAEKYKNKTKK